MIETLTLITLGIIALIVFRPGKPEPLDNPLVINRIGQFRAVLAPRINLAQPLLEAISRRLSDDARQGGNASPLYFKVTDKEVKAHGKDYYLLAVTLRDSVLYFQAAAPADQTSDLDTLRAAAEAELSTHPPVAAPSAAAETALIAAVRAAASERGASVERMVG